MLPLKSLTHTWVAVMESRETPFNFSRKDGLWFSRMIRKYRVNFFTTVLPELGKAVKLSAITGKPVVYPSWLPLKGGYPLLWRQGFQRLFTDVGVLRPMTERNITLFKDFCQLTMMYYKLCVPTCKTDAEALNELIDRQNAPSIYFEPEVEYLTRKFIRQALKGFDVNRAISKPRWSTGAVMEKVDRIERIEHHNVTCPDIPEEILENFWYNYTHFCDDPYLFERKAVTNYARVSFVPKDSRGPRVICCESAVRQAVHLSIQEELHNSIRINTHNEIPIERQEVMHDTLRAYGYDCATIDLEAASDSVRIEHVERLFPGEVADLLSSVRSTEGRASGDATPFTLTTAFPMGSAVCFPVESLIFWGISKAVSWLNGTTLCRVYGDDIIVDRRTAIPLIDTLRNAGFVVNQDKSCYTDNSIYRESCGLDLIHGVNVRTISMKRTPRLPGVSALAGRIGLISFLNAIMADGGYDHHLVVRFEQIWGITPFVVSPLPIEVIGPYRASNSLFYKKRYHKGYQKYQLKVRTLMKKVKVPLKTEDDALLLWDWFTAPKLEQYYHSDRYVTTDTIATRQQYQWLDYWDS